jgi:hypothetical protein
MGLDIYSFAASDLLNWQTGIKNATDYGHSTFVEEFAMQRWVQNQTPPLADNEANSIKGAMSCDWEPPYSYNLDNLFSSFLPWISNTGATSASLFDSAVLAACISAGSSQTNVGLNSVLLNANMSFTTAPPAYSDASYHLASLLSNWNRSVWSQPPFYSPATTTIQGISTIH